MNFVLLLTPESLAQYSINSWNSGRVKFMDAVELALLDPMQSEHSIDSRTQSLDCRVPEFDLPVRLAGRRLLLWEIVRRSTLPREGQTLLQGWEAYCTYHSKCLESGSRHLSARVWRQTSREKAWKDHGAVPWGWPCVWKRKVQGSNNRHCPMGICTIEELFR